MKIAFIFPAIGKKKNEKFIHTWKMEPLTIAFLKALTPDDIETEFFDDRIELINYDTDVDLIALSVETYTAKRAYKIAKEFRKRGKKVIMGGYHITLNYKEAMNFADAIIVGNAESVWGEVLEDFKKGKLKRIYRGNFGFTNNSVLPDRTIFKGKKYLPLKLVETGRGCPFKCEFCAISSFYNSRYYQRDIREIIEDIEKSEGKYFFFIDDNIAGNKEFLRKLCVEVEPLKIFWVSQGSLNVAKDISLLKLMKKSGCQLLLIGFESIDEKNLRQMNKEWILKLGNRNELVKRIHGEGINIYATFVFGFDYDNDDTFKKALDFSLKHDFFFSAFNHLLPFPGTPLYERLKKEKRLLKEKWWLGDYKYGEIVFKPRNFSPEELAEKCKRAREEFFRFSSIIKRFKTFLKRKPNLPLLYTFLVQNFNLKKEVEGKFGIPIGENLDELPK